MGGAEIADLLGIAVQGALSVAALRSITG